MLFETFSVTERDVLGVDVVHDLKPRGRDVGVTDANKAEYVKLLVEWHAEQPGHEELFRSYNVPPAYQDVFRYIMAQAAGPGCGVTVERLYDATGG